MSDSSTEYAATKAMAVVAVISLVAALVVWSTLSALGAITLSTLALASGVVAQVALVVPLVYWFVLRPVAQEHDKRRTAERAVEDLNRLAITDTLTRLMNRRGITVNLLDAMAQAERYGAPLTVLMTDIDNFREFNDAHGRDAGDKLLSDVAAILADALRMPDKVGRYGDEEFLAVLPHTPLAHGRKIAERMRTTVAKWDFDVHGTVQHVTVSAGIAQFRKGEDLEALLARTDEALVEAKTGGRNRVAAGRSA